MAMAASPTNNIWVLLGLSIATSVLLFSRSRKKLRDIKDFGAFIKYFNLLPPPQPAPPVAPHPLTNLTFAVKDIFDIEGLVTGFGNPDWERTHEPALQTAPAVSALVQAGATCIGKTHMDEMAYSINGENKHYGTPVNPAALNRVPGGSSSGSAVSVAGGLVDFALGTDTAGSVRIPAAYCGILGFRPSHGFVTSASVVPMAQSFDTVGWFARDPNVLQKVGQVLLPQYYLDWKKPRNVLIADDCFSLSDNQQMQLSVVLNSVEKTFGSQVIKRMKLGDYLLSKIPSLNIFLKEENSNTDPGITALKSLRNALQLIQRYEFKRNHEDWVCSVKPDLGPGISERVKAALETTAELVPEAIAIKEAARSALLELLQDGCILILPTSPGVPPKLKSRPSVLANFRDKAFTLLSVAGMSGCCQVSIPIGRHDKCPAAVSLIASYRADLFLLNITRLLFESLQMEAEAYGSGKLAAPKKLPNPEAAELAKEKGNAAFNRKDFRAAIDCYSEAIRHNETNPTYYNNRAAAYLAIRSFQQAELDSDKAIELDKKNVKAYLRRGTARESLGYYREAEEDFRQSLVLEPTNKTAAEGVKRLKMLMYG